MLPLRNIWENRQRASAFDGFDDKPLFSFCLYFCIGIFGAIRFLAICFICLHFGANGFCVNLSDNFGNHVGSYTFSAQRIFGLFFCFLRILVCNWSHTYTETQRQAVALNDTKLLLPRPRVTRTHCACAHTWKASSK